MNQAWRPLIISCALALLALPVLAQPAPAGDSSSKTNCSKARNPQNCEARQKAMENCHDKTGPARRACVEDAMPPRDCSQAKSPQRCEAQQKAREACKGKEGKERRNCMREQIKKKGARN
jgi:hypothetical protein